MKTYIVIGMGRFGTSIATQLCQLGNEVMAMDTHQELVQKISPYVTSAVSGDARDLDVLRALGVQNFDCAIVAVGSDLATAVLVALNLRELGVPNIICKAQDEMQKRALEKIGADQVIIPEREMGIKIAQKLSSHNILDFIELSADYGIGEFAVLPEWADKTIAELNIRAKCGLNIIAIRRDKATIVSPTADFVLQAEDILVVIGRNTDMTRMQRV